MSASKIEWTEETWNPTTGCNKVSAGCKNCYAEALSRRLQKIGVSGYAKGFEVAWHEERLEIPKRKRRPTTYFVNSMSDLFHERIPPSFLTRVFSVIEETPRHRYQILTKRPRVMRDYFAKREAPKNAWLGVSVENKKDGVPRIDILREVACRHRFLSCEPLLEHLGELDLSDIHWVIVGGESGKKARPMRGEWAEDIQRQCAERKVPFFFKQWGEYGEDGVRRGKKANGRRLQRREWNSRPRGMTTSTSVRLSQEPSNPLGTSKSPFSPSQR